MALHAEPFGTPGGSSAGSWNPLAGIKRNFDDPLDFDRRGFTSPSSIAGRSSVSFVSTPSTPLFPATPALESLVASPAASWSVLPPAAVSSSPRSATASQPSSVQIRVGAPLDGNKLGLKVKENVITEVVDGRSLQFGWKAGDRVTAVNGVPARDLDSFALAVAGAVRQWQSTGRPLVFDISRGGPGPRRRSEGCC